MASSTETSAFPQIPTEAELIEQAKAGSIDAFGKLYGLHYPSVAQSLVRVVGANYAEDVAQETFIHALRKIHDFEDKGKGLRPWLHVISRNAARDGARRARRRPDTDTLPLYDTNPDPHENVETSALNRVEINTALENLPPHQRTTVEALLIGMSTEEFAAEQGIDVPTVRTRMHRARGIFRELVRAGALDDIAS